jgi:hypothetical protein
LDAIGFWIVFLPWRVVMTFTPNKKFKKKYDKLFKKDPLAANTFLLICELAGEKGQVVTDEKEIADLIAIRFEDPRRYAL